MQSMRPEHFLSCRRPGIGPTAQIRSKHIWESLAHVLRNQLSVHSSVSLVQGTEAPKSSGRLSRQVRSLCIAVHVDTTAKMSVLQPATRRLEECPRCSGPAPRNAARRSGSPAWRQTAASLCRPNRAGSLTAPDSQRDVSAQLRLQVCAALAAQPWPHTVAGKGQPGLLMSCIFMWPSAVC